MSREVVQGIDRAERSQGQKSQMGHKVSYIEQGMILAELIEIQPGETVAFHGDMFGRKIAVGRGQPQRLELQNPMLHPVQNVAKDAAGLSLCGRQPALLSAEDMQVAREAVFTPTLEATRVQPVQPLGCPFHCPKGGLPSQNDFAHGRALFTTQDQDLPGRMVGQRLRDGETPLREAETPELLTILINTCSVATGV